MDIVLCTDNNYVMPCGVTMISVMENNRNIPIMFHIIGVDLIEESKKEILSITKKYDNASISFYEIKEDMFNSYNLEVLVSDYLSLTAYTRLFLTNILPSSINKILYIDCDVIVLKNLTELWNTNIDLYSIGGVIDFLSCMPNTFIDLSYDFSFRYINSGILLINLNYWREHNLVDTFLSFYKGKYDKVPYCDQDVINGTLYDSKILLPIKYNTLDLCYQTIRPTIPEYEEEIVMAIHDPAIIHYNGPDKPWLKTCTHPLKNEFLKYKKISLWKNVPLSWGKTSFSKKIKYYKRVILYDTFKLKRPIYIRLSKDLSTGKYSIK